MIHPIIKYIYKGHTREKNVFSELIYSSLGHPRCRWVCFFIVSYFKNCSITSLAHQWYSLQWMGAIRTRDQTADKNIAVIHTTPVHQLTSCEVKSCVFVINKSSRHFNLKRSLLAKIWVNNQEQHFLQWKSPSSVVRSHQNPPRLEPFQLVNGTWSVHMIPSWFRWDDFFRMKKAKLWIETVYFKHSFFTSKYIN